MTFKRYTKEEDEYLKENYLKKTKKEMSEELGRTVSSIETRCCRSLGLKKTIRGKRYTKEEDEYLKKNYLIKTKKEMSEDLGRTVNSIEKRRRTVLNLKKTRSQRREQFIKNLYSSKTLPTEQLKQNNLERNLAERDKLKGKVPDEWLELPATQWQAKEKNIQHYFTGKPCRKGHLRPRNKNSRCLECERLRDQEGRKNIEYKLKKDLRKRLSQALKDQNTTKDQTTKKLVGCSMKTLVSHFESLFTDDMNWNNHGKWHIDHIRPCSSFKLLDKEQQDVCFNWRNLQPLDQFVNANIKKDRYTPLDELAWVEKMQALGYEGELFLKYEEGNSY